MDLIGGKMKTGQIIIKEGLAEEHVKKAASLHNHGDVPR